MKAVIAAACVAVIIAVGYFFWGEYSAHAERERAQRAAVLSSCEDMVVSYHAFARRKAELPEGIGGKAEFQNKANQCAGILKSELGYDITVDENGVVMR